MDMQTQWESHRSHLEYRLEKDGIGDIGYAFDVFEDDNGYYYSLILSGGGPSASMVFRVNEDNLFLDKIEYEIKDFGEQDVIDITQDVFANELWDMFDEAGVVNDKWTERY